MTKTTEKRGGRRFFLRIPAKCEVTDSKGKIIGKKEMVIYNLSSDGIYLEADDSIPLESEIKVIFQLPGGQHTIKASTKVMRLEMIEPGKIFGIGAAFKALSEEDRDMIGKFIERSDINNLLELCIEKGVSDLHLVANHSPVARINGELHVLNMPKLEISEIPFLIYSLMTSRQIRQFEIEKELNFGYQYDSNYRFRVNVHQQRGFIEAAIRLIHAKTPSFEELRLPAVLKDLARLSEGLILITGSTGSGKTTTIAAMVELLNREKKRMIITLERPIEYVHSNINSIIKQREVGIDTLSFSAALKNSLKQDPDVLVVGELEDEETIRTALIAAESGHLVIASFHAPNTTRAIDRLVNMLPPENRKQLLFQLSESIKGIVTQLLIPRSDKKGRVLACEIAIANEAVNRLIRCDELLQLPNVIKTGGEYKMCLMQDAIKKYADLQIIDRETADVYYNTLSKHE